MNARMTVAPAQKLLGVHRLTQVEVDRIINNNCTEDFCKLQGVPGYCLQKLSWEAACQLAREATFESLGTLGRHPSDIVVYRRFRGKVLQEYVTMADFVSATILGYDTCLLEDGKRRAVPPSVTCAEPQTYWRRNDFPYNFEPGIEHHNIWSTQPLPPERIVQIADEHRQGWEFVWFINPVGLASIPAVWHAHVLSRRRAD